LDHCLRLGITMVEDIGHVDDLEVYAALLARDALPIRVRVSPPLDGDLGRYRQLRADHASPMLGMGFLKAFVDGVIESKTAFMVEPFEGGDERGKPLIPP